MSMNYEQKVQFIANFMSSMQDKFMKLTPNLPEDWDGIELRHWIADSFSYECYPMDRARKRAYENEVIVRNL